MIRDQERFIRAFTYEMRARQRAQPRERRVIESDEVDEQNAQLRLGTRLVDVLPARAAPTDECEVERRWSDKAAAAKTQCTGRRRRVR
jgi:hypothetical protein